MGIRHQFWVIAKVGSRYRTLAVVHCQNATGTDATRACSRLLNIFGSGANKKLIDHELNHALTKPDDWWELIRQRLRHRTPEDRFPFPFIQTCLVLGAAYDSRRKPFPFFFPVRAYEAGISPINLTFNNQTGNTILEITDLNELRYCFMFSPSTHPDSPDDDELPRCRPLGPQEYLSYPDVIEHDLDVDLSQWRLIALDTLRELWPEVSRPDQNEEAPCSQQTPHHQTASIVPSLKDLSFQTSMEKALDNYRMEEALDLLENIPDLSRRLRQLLYDSPEFVKRPNGIALLGHAMRTETVLDFSPFPWLLEGAITQVVENNTCRQEVASIDLSCNGNVSVALVAKLLVLFPNITTLAAVHTAKLPLEALSKALVGRSQIELYHSDLFRAAFDVSPFVSDQGRKFVSPLANLPNHNGPNGTLSQIVFFSINREIPGSSSLRLKGGGLKWSKLAQNWSDLQSPRGCDFFGASIPLHDALLNPSHIGTWLAQLLWFFATNGAINDMRSYREGHATMGCACALAMNTEENWRVRPIPATALVRPRLSRSILRKSSPVMRGDINTGEWTMLITVEDKPPRHWFDRRCEQLRYAFVKGDIDTRQWVRCGLSKFCEHTTGRAPTQEMFPSRIPCRVTECEVDEIDEIIESFIEKSEDSEDS